MRWYYFAFCLFIFQCLPAFGSARGVTKKTIRTLRTAKLNLPNTFTKYEVAEGAAGCSQLFVMVGLPKPILVMPNLVLERAADEAADKLDGLFENIAQHFPRKIAATMRAMYVANHFVTFDLESTETFWKTRRDVISIERKTASTPVSLRTGFATSKVASRILLLTLSIHTGIFLVHLSEADSAEVNDLPLNRQEKAAAVLWLQMEKLAMEHAVQRLVPDLHIAADLQLNVPDHILIAQFIGERKFIAHLDLRRVLLDYFGPKFFPQVEDIDDVVDAFLVEWDS